MSAGRRLPVGDGPDGVVIDAGGTVWVASSFSDQVVRVDAVTGDQQVVTFPADSKPLAMAASADAIYVTLAGSGQVARIDPTTLGVQLLTVSPAPTFLAWGDGSLWVTSGGTTVDRIDPATYTVVATIPVEGANGIAIAGGSAWVTAGPSQQLVKIDLATNQVVGQFGVGANPDAIVASGDAVWLTNRGDGTVMRFDTSTEQVTGRITTGTAPAGIFIDGDRVWVTDFAAGTLTLVDRVSATLVRSIAIGYRPLNLAATGDRVWVAVAGDDVLAEVHVWEQAATAPRVSVVGIEVTTSRYIPTFSTQNFTPSIAGDLHVHLYWNTIAGTDAGAPGAGPWLLWDQPTRVDDAYFDIVNRPPGANAICAVAATHGHAVADLDGDGTPDYDSGSCLQIPS